MSNPQIPRFAVISVNGDGNLETQMFHTPDLADTFVSRLSATTPFYRTKVISARVFNEVVLSSAGRKAGTTVPKKEKK